MPQEIDAGALVAFLQRLVRAPSIAGNEVAAVAEIEALTQTWGWQTERWEVAPGRPNLVATIEGGQPGPTLLFEGHTDVVATGDPEAWSHHPFGGEVVDGRLYGRGSADMKAGVAAMLFAARGLQLQGPFPGRILVACLVDEEGLMLGVKDFVARGRAAGVDAAIVCEPEADEVCTSQKGAIRIRVVAHGRMAHGAMPQHGVNPIPPLLDYVQHLTELQRELQERNGEHPHLGWDYITPTVLQANVPEQLNVIPEEASAWIDIRTTPATDHPQLIALLQERLPSNLELIVIDDRPATETPPDHPVVRAVVAAHEQVHKATPPFGGVPGSTDGTILWRDAGIPIVTYGPGGKWIAHQVDEYVEVDEVVSAAEVYLEAARRFLTEGIDSSKSRV